MTQILITGTSGFIGTRLCHELTERKIAFTPLKRTPDWPDDICKLDLSKCTAIVHLAQAPIQATDPEYLSHAKNVKPIEFFLRQIAKTNPECHFIFTSSQTAQANTSSVYGKLKFEAEKILENSSASFTIIRPGLVIDRAESQNSGLFGRILEVVKRSPVIPLVGSGKQPIQPVPVDLVVQAIINICQDPTRHRAKIYSLAYPPMPLKSLLQACAKSLGKRRLFLPVPVFAVNSGLVILEKLWTHPPITHSSLKGLLELHLIPNDRIERSLDALGLHLPPLSDLLRP